MPISIELIRKLSPDSLSVMEFRNSLDVEIAQKMLKFPSLGDDVDGKWRLRLTAEFHMTNDSHLFKTKPAKGCLPLYEGKMAHQFDHKFSEPRYWVNEAEGRAAKLGKTTDEKQILDYQKYRLGFRSIARNSDERTVIVCPIPKNVFCGNSLLVNSSKEGHLSSAELLLAQGVLNSFIIDFYMRLMVSANINMFFIYQLPVPRLTTSDPAFAPIVERAAKLVCTTPEFQEMKDELGKMKKPDGSPLFHPSSFISHPSERAQLRAELDAIVARLYGLSESELAHILSTFPLVGEDVKAGVMREFGKMGKSL